MHYNIHSHHSLSKISKSISIPHELRDIDQISECQTDFLKAAAADAAVVAWKIYIYVNWEEARKTENKK